MLAYSSNKQPIAGRTRFQKMIFILQNVPFCPKEYTFVPHDYGPYSKELQADIDDLIANKLLLETQEVISSGKIKYHYVITSIGTRKLARIMDLSNLNKRFKFNKLIKSCEEIKNQLNSKDLSSLLEEIYIKYPEFAALSKFKF